MTAGSLVGLSSCFGTIWLNPRQHIQPDRPETDRNNEYAVAADLLGLDEAGVVALARIAVTRSFAESAVKQRLLAEIEATLPREDPQRP